MGPGEEGRSVQPWRAEVGGEIGAVLRPVESAGTVRLFDGGFEGERVRCEVNGEGSRESLWSVLVVERDSRC